MAGLLDATACQQVQLLAADTPAGRQTGVLGRVLVFEGGDRTYADVQLAWTLLLRRNPGLRVRFRQHGGYIRQELRAYDELPAESRFVQLPGETPAARDSGIEPYGPVLIRSSFVPCDGGGELTLLVHHVLVDEHALGIVVDFLRRAVADPGRIDAGERRGYEDCVAALIDASIDSRDRSAEYWRRQLAPGGTARAPVWKSDAGTLGNRHEVTLDAAVTSDLRASARAANASLPIMVHAALAVLLHRYGLGDRQVIGIPTTLRDHPAVGFDVVGLFTTVVPAAVDVSDGDTLGEVLLRTRATLLELHDHKFTSLMEIPGLGDLSRSESAGAGGGYFGVTLAVRQQSDADCAAGVRPLHLGQPVAPLHIDVIVGESASSLVFTWRHAVRPWPEAGAMAAHLLRVLAALGASPHVKVNGFDLDPAARRGRAPLGDGAALVPESVWRTCIGSGDDRPVVADHHSAWTSAELARAVGRVRAALESRELPPGSRIGVACGRTMWQVASILAVWQEGLCYVPMDPAGPPDRNRLISQDAELRAVIGRDAPLPALLDLAQVERMEPTVAAPYANRAEEPAYVMYTSGTGGRPKGVVITHGNLAGFAAAMSEALPIGDPGRWLAETDATFDISLVELVLPLACGQSILIGDTARRDGAGGAARFDYRQCTPSRARQLLTARDVGEPTGHWDVQPRVWLLGGEVLPGPLLRDLRAAFPSTIFVNMYGPTEATIWSTYSLCGADPVDDVPIGRPLANTETLVVDRAGRCVPPGAVGELLIGGGGVAAGYLNRPELDVSHFVRAADDSPPMYRSGDLVQIGPDGELYFRGRADDQVKIRGHRIELAEVESALRAQAEVAEAAVVVVDGGRETAHLAAAVVARPGHGLDLVQLRVSLAERLPAAMIPAAYAVVPALPRLPSGKIDRGLVAGYPFGTPTQGAATSAPAGDDQRAERVAQAMTVLLGRPIGADDDFFHAGGNSLTALRLIAALRDRDVEVRALDVFERRTARGIAAAARSA